MSRSAVCVWSPCATRVMTAAARRREVKKLYIFLYFQPRVANQHGSNLPQEDVYEENRSSAGGPEGPCGRRLVLVPHREDDPG